jgi:6-phosphogluconolactonase/glucosamine-6-phosphate isomerase/deaminase
MVLDEWGGFGPGHPLSCQFGIREPFAKPLGLPEINFHTLDGSTRDPALECRRYDQLLEKFGPADLAILGLGINGHIGLNEPAPQLSAQAHMTKLAPSTLTRVKSQMGDDQAPTHGLTLGMAQIMGARQLLLLASGRQKAKAVKKMLSGPITTEFPASLLQLHPAATFLIDEAAAGHSI